MALAAAATGMESLEFLSNAANVASVLGSIEQGIEKFSKAGRSYRKAEKTYKQAKRAFKGMRGKKSSRAKNMGEPPGRSPGKHALATRNIGTIDTRTLYQDQLVVISPGDDTDNRLMNTCHIKGLKLNLAFRNDLTSEGLYLNVAVVIPKGISNTETNLTSEFFGGHGGSNRSLDFGTNLDANEIHMCPINSGRHDILMHRRMYLNPQTLGGNPSSQTAASEIKFSRWIPINRVVHFDQSGIGLPSDNNPRLVYWVDKPFTTAGTAASTAVATIQHHCYVHFKDVM